MKSWLKPALRAAVLMLIPALAQVSSADAPAANPDLVKALSQYVVVLNHPIYVYNWFDPSGRSAQWRTQLSATDAIGYDHVVTMVAKHFQALCTGDSTVDSSDCTQGDTNYGTDNMFGPGLYASVDPIATASYGGSSDWVLLQIHLQKGSRLASLVWQTENNAFSPAALQQLNDMQCGFDGSGGVSSAFHQMLMYFYQQNYSNQSAKTCAAAIRNILKDQLKIDGIYYPYNGSTFKECDANLNNAQGVGFDANGNSIRQGAFVITSTTNIKPTDVEVFNSQSRDANADRMRIATLFYRATSSQIQQAPPAAAASVAYYQTQSIPKFPNYKVTKWAANGCFTVNGAYACGDWFELCDLTSGNGCTYTVLPLIGASPAVAAPVISTISSSTFPTQLVPSQKLLWDDLEGQSQDPDAGKWIKNNLLGCSDIAPYGRIPSLRYGRFYPKPVDPNN